MQSTFWTCLHLLLFLFLNQPGNKIQRKNKATHDQNTPLPPYKQSFTGIHKTVYIFHLYSYSLAYHLLSVVLSDIIMILFFQLENARSKENWTGPIQYSIIRCRPPVQFRSSTIY